MLSEAAFWRCFARRITVFTQPLHRQRASNVTKLILVLHLVLVCVQNETIQVLNLPHLAENSTRKMYDDKQKMLNATAPTFICQTSQTATKLTLCKQFM